jgi:hypothetical protein
MKPVVKLKDVIDEMDAFGDRYRSFLNIETGELVSLSEEEINAAVEGEPVEEFPAWQHDLIRKADEVLSTDIYRELPSKFDIHEYSIMERFCCSVQEDELSSRLINGIHGRGAFRRFKDMIRQYGIADDWYEYHYQAIREIAIFWLDENKIAYTEENDEENGGQTSMLMVD